MYNVQKMIKEMADLYDTYICDVISPYDSFSSVFCLHSIRVEKFPLYEADIVSWKRFIFASISDNIV